MVFCGLFPIEASDYPDFRDALEKLSLNDAALAWEPENSDALGFGFRAASSACSTWTSSASGSSASTTSS